MKMNKIAAAVLSGAVAASAMAVSASAEDISINATLGFTDTSWSFQDWEATTEVTGDGTYTVTSTAVAGAADFGVFVVDLNGMFAAYPEATATLDKVEVDGAEITVDASKIVYGDVEEKGNYRIEIYNIYGSTKDDPGVNSATAINESLAITFTVSGLGGAAAEEAVEETVEETVEEATEEVAEETTEEAPASDNVTAPAATGNASAAAIVSVMAVAAAAAVISKKRN